MDAFESKLLSVYGKRMPMKLAETLIGIRDRNFDEFYAEFQKKVTHYWSSGTVSTMEFIAYRRLFLR